MNNNKTILGTLLSATVLLAAMGCWFCWHCPSRIYPPESHGLFWRQLMWNGVGLAVFAGAWLAGWWRLLKAAPWLMAAWLVAIAAAQLSYPVRGVHKWLSLGPFRVNVAICFMPVAALFFAWLRDRKRLRPWMWLAALSLAAVWVVWHVAGDVGRMERLAAFFNPDNWMQDRAYMSRQLLAAFGASHWFGDAGRSLGLLPCPESDGMMSASALMFGKWFPAVLVGLFAVVGASLTLLWKGAGDAAKRMFAFLIGLWLTVPAAYCFLHSLGFLPVAGMSPALAGYGGTAAVMAWFGTGVLAAMARKDAPEGGCGTGTGIGVVTVLGICCAWIVIAALGIGMLVLRCLAVEAENLKFAEPRPSDMEFGEFGLVAKRGRILAADGSFLAYTVRKWRFYLDPCVPDVALAFDKERLAAIADGLGVPVKRLLQGYIRTDGNIPYRLVCSVADELGVSVKELHDANANTDTIFMSPNRYIFLTEVEDGSPASVYFARRQRWLGKCAGIIREPVQKRVYPLGEAATAVVGFMHGGAHTDTPQGAGGLEWAFDKPLAGTNGAYDASLRLDERVKRATPAPGADISTTIVPGVQKAVWGFLAAACATNGAESAFALVTKVPSGEIAAMASWPSFDPSMRRNLDKWDASMAVNRPAQAVFEPGGLVKPLTYAIALNSGLLAEDAKIDQEDGAWEYNGETFRDEATNSVTIAEAIEKHLNIAAGKTACLVGPGKFHSALLRFGFGLKTGTAGISGEGNGILTPKPEYWDMDKTTAMRVGMGYGFAATGLQIAQAYATLANHGTFVRPVLVKTAATNDVVQVVSPTAADAIMRVIKSPISSTVQMCEHDRETGRSVYSPTNYIASCVGVHPAGKPEYVIVVSFTKPRTAHTGDEVAVPVVLKIADSL